MNWNEKREHLQALVSKRETIGREDKAQLSDALYAFDEIVGWPDCVDSVSVPHALMIWALVDKILADGFRKDLNP